MVMALGDHGVGEELMTKRRKKKRRRKRMSMSLMMHPSQT